MLGNIRRAVMDVESEVLRAYKKFPEPFASPHEAYAILLEEVDELWSDVQAAQKPRLFGCEADGAAALSKVRFEAIQVAAMAVRMIVDIDTGCFSRRKV